MVSGTGTSDSYLGFSCRAEPPASYQDEPQVKSTLSRVAVWVKRPKNRCPGLEPHCSFYYDFLLILNQEIFVASPLAGV